MFWRQFSRFSQFGILILSAFGTILEARRKIVESAQNTVHGDDFEGSAVWKKQTETSENASNKNIEQSSKNGSKTIKKRKKYMNDQKMYKKIDLGNQLLAQKAVWGRFLGSWGNQKIDILKGN